jgi:hypothetical protein
MQHTSWQFCSGNVGIQTVDYRFEDGPSSVSVSCVTISKPDSLCNSDTGVNPGIKSWQNTLLD